MQDRNIIIVLGQQGQGKSLWTKEYVRDKDRLCVWDPKRSYAVEYPPDVAQWWEESPKPMRSFRVGGFYPEQAEILGSISFAEQRSVLVLEECGLLFAPRADLDEWARECVYLGRERGVSVVAVAQRPRSINIALRSQASRIITFKQREEKDLDFLEECFDPSEVLNLPRLSCLDFDVDSGEVSRYAVTIPAQSPAQPAQEVNPQQGDPLENTKKDP